MKKTSLLASFICGAILLTFAGCGGTGTGEQYGENTSVSSSVLTSSEAAADSGSENSEETSLSEQEKPEESTKITMLDGKEPTEAEIVKVDESESGRLYTVNAVFAYPFGAPGSDRKPKGKAAPVKLTEGSKWGDFTVSKAESVYKDYDAFDEVFCQYLCLKGDISFEGKAYISSNEEGEGPFFEHIVLEMPEELYKELPSLARYKGGLERNLDCTKIFLDPYDFGVGEAVANALENSEELTVSVSADEIRLEYTWFGLVTDGTTTGFFENVTDFEIK